jgi:hydroxymethylpyrimidine/phosphomethylpyrimidine kinase
VGSTDPTAVQIVAGTDGTDTAAITADSMTIGTSGVNTFPAITGLSPNTTYRNAIVHYALPE